MESTMSILIINLNPTFQRTMIFKNFQTGEVNRSKRVLFDVSGKGINIARVLSQKNMRCDVLTHIGKEQSDEYIAKCTDDGINLLYALSDGTNRTCTTIICDNENPTELVEEAHAVNLNCTKEIKDIFYSNLDNYEIIIITGTRAPGYDDLIYADFIKEAKHRGKFVILDICKNELLKALPYNPNIIKPNLSEFCITFFDEVVMENEDTEYLKDKISSKMQQLYEMHQIKTIITRGKNNTWVFDESGFYEIDVHSVDNCVNTIGCGDTFLASLAFNLSNELSLKECILKASVDSSLNATTIRPGSLI
jgi:fructose-1-phosphate kinase PfkB-like protein